MIRWSLALALVVACTDDEPPEVRFVPVAEVHADQPAQVLISTGDMGLVRAKILEALPHATQLVGSGPWETIRVEEPGRDLESRTYIRRGGGLRLDVRLAAGDRGAFMGGRAEMGAERVMVQTQLDDPTTLRSRFEVRIHRGGEDLRTHDVTPRYMRPALPRGTYRAWIDAPPRGASFTVEVRTLDPENNVVGVAWSSPIHVVRPWL